MCYYEPVTLWTCRNTSVDEPDQTWTNKISEGVVVMHQRNLKKKRGFIQVWFYRCHSQSRWFYGLTHPWYLVKKQFAIVGFPYIYLWYSSQWRELCKDTNRTNFLCQSKPTAPLPMRIAVPICMKTTQHEDCSLQGLAAMGVPIISLVLEVSINNWSYIRWPKFLVMWADQKTLRFSVIYFIRLNLWQFSTGREGKRSLVSSGYPPPKPHLEQKLKEQL